MVNHIKICMFMIILGQAHASHATDYYIKNELPFAVNVQIDCGSVHDTLAIGSGVTAYFRTIKCTEVPSLSVTAAGTMAADALKKVKKISLSKPYARLYLDKNKDLVFEMLDLAKDAVAQDNIQNYDLAL